MMNAETLNPEVDFQGKSHKDFNFDVVILDKTYKTSLSISNRYSERYGVKVNRIFISGTPNPEELPASHSLYLEQLKPGPRGVDLELDKKWKKYNRNEVKIYNMFINRFLDHINSIDSQDMVNLFTYLIGAGFDKRKFNLYAGCSMCKCSPGFTMKGESVHNKAFYLDFTEVKES